MKYCAVVFLCSIILFPGDVSSFGFIREFLFPRMPSITRISHPEDARIVGDEFAVLNTAGIVEQYGYPVQQHSTTTADGYNITLFRIPGSPVSPGNGKKSIVFLQSGVFASSDSWVLFGPGKDLAFLLADAGYDVWLGNMRGNSYGRSHIVISPSTPSFWDFSYHEIAMRDLPRMIDFVLDYTGRKDLSYIGTSMGTTIAFVLLSELPEYNDKIRLLVCLAPVALWKYPPKFILRSSIEEEGLREIFEQNGIHELAPQTKNNVRLGRALCRDGALTQPFCELLFAMLAGNDPDQLNSTALPKILSHFPAGGSAATLYHYQQNIKAGTVLLITRSFQKFNYGYIKNFRLYGRKNPPTYDVKKVSAPVALIYAKNDIVSLKENTVELAKRLPNVVAFEAVPLDTFNHLDFLWAKDAKKLLYDRVIELVNLYSKS